MKKIAALTLALLALGARGALAQEVDQSFGDLIRYIDDKGQVAKLEKVQVTSATYEKITYDIRGRTGNDKDGNLVIAIEYADAPRVYSEGLASKEKGRYEQAASDFDGARNAVELGKARKWLLEYAAVNRADSLRALGAKEPAKLGEAVKEYQKALEANPKSLLFDRIQIGLSLCFSSMGKNDEAKSAAEALTAAGTQIKQPVWICQGLEAAAKSLTAQAKFADAANAFNDLVLSAQREIKWAKSEYFVTRLTQLEISGALEQGWAKVSRAESTKSASDWDDAKRYFEGLPARYPDSEGVAAGVLNGVGRCLHETDPRAAVMKFAEAEVTHFTAKNEVARALWLKSESYKKLATQTGSSRYRTMAEEALKELREFYGDTEWARK